MTRLDRHLLIVVACVGLAAVAAAAPRREAPAVVSLPLSSLPDAIGAWHGRTIADDDILPPDSRSVDSIRRRYESASSSAWLGVARYTAGNAPERRPALDALVPARGIMSSTSETASISLENRRTIPAIRRSTRYATRTLTTWYWYQIGPRAVGDEYGLRMRLGVNTILGQHHPLFLIRVITTDDSPTAFIRALVPHLDHLMARANGSHS